MWLKAIFLLDSDFHSSYRVCTMWYQTLISCIEHEIVSDQHGLPFGNLRSALPRLTGGAMIC